MLGRVCSALAWTVEVMQSKLPRRFGCSPPVTDPDRTSSMDRPFDLSRAIR